MAESAFDFLQTLMLMDGKNRKVDILKMVKGRRRPSEEMPTYWSLSELQEGIGVGGGDDEPLPLGLESLHLRTCWVWLDVNHSGIVLKRQAASSAPALSAKDGQPLTLWKQAIGWRRGWWSIGWRRGWWALSFPANKLVSGDH